MIDVDDLLRDELERLVRVEAKPDWDAVVAGSGLKRERLRVRLGVGGALLVAAALLGLTTPLGSALARGLDGFSAWLTGQPGSPASTSQQRAFEQANEHSWLGFPKGTELRHLITQHAGSTRIDLYGFRSGTSAFCLRLVVQGKARTATQRCASLADLRLAGSPIRVVFVDQPVGTGNKTAWYGLDRLHSANLQITAGIADDSVRSVILRDNQGRHQVAASSNAFLYVAQHPQVGQRVAAVSARTTHGVVPVAFAPSPFGIGAGPAIPATAPTVAIQRHLHGGSIGWLEHREARGQPLSVLPPRIRSMLLGYRGGAPGRTKVIFGRVLTPDPNLPARIAVTLNAHHPGGAAAGICITLIAATEAGGGCSPYPGIFDPAPVTVGSIGDGPGEYLTVDGLASDAVDHLQALLANRQRLSVPLVDNAFIVNLPRGSLPARLIAYDRNGKVVGVSDPIEDFAAGGGVAPARGRATQLLHATGPGGAHSELFVGRSTTGGQCVYVRHYFNAHAAGLTVSCMGRSWVGPALQLESDATPTRFVSGRVRSDIATVRLRYADGTTTTLRPTRGYVLQAMTAPHLTDGHQLIGADGLNRNGKLIGHMSFQPPRKP